MIGTDGERESGKSVLAAQLDVDDDDVPWYAPTYIQNQHITLNILGSYNHLHQKPKVTILIFSGIKFGHTHIDTVTRNNSLNV